MDMKSCVSQQQISQLLHNKFVVVLGGSVLRSLYKDMVLLLQKDKYLTQAQLKSKGETTFEQDRLIEGGCLSQLNNGTSYREVRQFQSPHHLVRFYFVTRVYSRFMQSVLEDFRRGIKPDVVIINSCLWDISRYGYNWVSEYKRNLSQFFQEIVSVLPEESLVIWTQTMPLAEQIRGGFLVPEIGREVVEANFYSGTLADAHDVDVLDLHFLFRFSLRHRTKDGIHWNAIAHRRITSILMLHVSQAWGVTMTRTPLLPLPPFEDYQQETQHTVTREPITVAFTHFSSPVAEGRHILTPPQFQRHVVHHASMDQHNQRRGGSSPSPACTYARPTMTTRLHQPKYPHSSNGTGFTSRDSDYRQRPHVMRSRRVRYHYNPYSDQGRHDSYRYR